MAAVAAWRVAFGSAGLGESHEPSGLNWQGKYRIAGELRQGVHTVFQERRSHEPAGEEDHVNSRVFMTTLFRVAVAEADKAGQTTAGIDYLFLALLLSDSRAGQALRAAGIDPETTRALLRGEPDTTNVDAPSSDASDSDSPSTDASEADTDAAASDAVPEVTEQVRELLERAQSDDVAVYSTNVLAELLTESSGVIQQLLLQLDCSPDQIQAQLADLDSQPPAAETTITAIELDDTSGNRTLVVPAPIDVVRTTLADPERAHLWHMGIESITETDVPGTWQLNHTQHEKVQPKFATQLLRAHPGESLTEDAADDVTEISWDLWFPDAPKSLNRTVTFRLSPVDEGTEITVFFELHHRPQRVLFSSIRRYILKLHIFHITTKLARCFAQ